MTSSSSGCKAVPLTRDT